MYPLKQVITALEAICRDHGETIEERERRFGARDAPIREGLEKAGDPVINRNIRLALSQLQIEPEEFFRSIDNERSVSAHAFRLSKKDDWGE